MYTMANTTITVLRGVSLDEYGDTMDAGSPIATGIPAYLSSPAQSPFRPIILGTTVYMTGTIMPSTTREIVCILPSNTDLTNEDQILDDHTGILYQVLVVTQIGAVAGATPDMQATLRRVTSTQAA